MPKMTTPLRYYIPMNANPRTDAGRTAPAMNNLRSGGLMLGAVFCYSTISLAIALTEGAENPFLFSMGWRIGIAIGFAVFLMARYWQWFFNKRVWSLVKGRIASGPMWLTLIAYSDIALFTIGTAYMPIAIATILVQFSPIIFTFLMQRLDRRGRNYARITLTVVFLMGFGIVGFVFVLASQSGDFNLPTDAAAWRLAVGVIFVCGSAVVSAFNAYNFYLGRELSANHLAELAPNRNETDTDQIQMFYVILCSMIANIFAAAGNGAIGFGGVAVGIFDMIPLETVYYSIIWGAIAYAAAGIAHRKANLITHNLGINAMSYARPVFGVLLLFGFGPAYAVNIPYIDYFVIGTASIVTANLLINFEAERLSGFKALVTALWTCGAIVYLRGSDQLPWAGAGYFAGLALSATVCTLLLSFRVARLANRTRDEDNRTCALFDELKALSGRGVNDPAIGGHLPAIAASQGAELQNPGTAARGYFAAALRQVDPSDRERLVAAQAQLDALARSGRPGADFGELCAWFIFAGITVGLSWFWRPPISGLTAFLVEMFTMLFASVIVFLAVNVADLRRGRSARMLQRSDSGDYALVFQDFTRRHIEQGIIIAAGAAIVATYAGLLGYKWLGWFG